MHRFYCPTLATARLSDEMVLDADESRHAARVLRLEPGAEVELFDGRGTLATARLDRMEGDPGSAVAEVLDVRRQTPERPELHVAVTIPKGPRADDMVVQLSQVGVDHLIPLRTQRSIVDPRNAKLTRFGRIAVASAKQCGRPFVMQIHQTATLDTLFEQPHDLRLLATPDARPIQGLAFELHRAQQVLLLVGPEGGFTSEEQDVARSNGCRAWSFSNNILRIETAAITAAALVRYLARR